MHFLKVNEQGNSYAHVRNYSDAQGKASKKLQAMDTGLARAATEFTYPQITQGRDSRKLEAVSYASIYFTALNQRMNGPFYSEH